MSVVPCLWPMTCLKDILNPRREELYQYNLFICKMRLGELISLRSLPALTICNPMNVYVLKLLLYIISHSTGCCLRNWNKIQWKGLQPTVKEVGAIGEIILKTFITWSRKEPDKYRNLGWNRGAQKVGQVWNSWRFHKILCSFTDWLKPMTTPNS